MNLVHNILALTFGIFLGFLYYGSLLLQIKKLIKSKSLFFLIFGFFIRFLLIGAFIFLIFKFGNFTQILLFFVGFLIVMISMVTYQSLKKRNKSYEN